MRTHNKPTKPLAVLAAAFLITLAPAAAPASAADFEGRIDMKMSSPSAGQDASITMGIYIKEPKLRAEISVTPGGTAGGQSFSTIMITDIVTRENIVILPAQKMYMVTQDKDGGAHASPPDADSYKPTGRTDTILGRRVEEYASAGGDEYTEMWLVRDLGAFRMAGGGLDATARKKSWEKYLADNGLFPLKVTSYKKKGDKQVIYQLEVVKIEKASLPASLFTPPADYKKIDMGGLFGGMMAP
jgi:hypothetical protein